MDDDALKKLLIQEVFAQKDALFLVYSRKHACSIRFDSGLKKWCFYDPNYRKGEKIFSSVSELIKAIHTMTGNDYSLSIQIASWNPTIQTSKFDEACNELLTNNMSNLLRGGGLHEIVRHAPSQITELVKSANQNKNARAVLATALQAQVSDGVTNLHKIAGHAPDQLAGIITLAKEHEDIRKSLAVALQIHKDGWTGLHVIARHASNQLAEIIALAKEHEDIRKSLASALQIKNKDGLTGLRIIAIKEPSQLAEIVILAKTDIHILFSLVDSLNVTDENGTTGLATVKKHSPTQLAACNELIKIVQLIQLESPDYLKEEYKKCGGFIAIGKIFDHKNHTDILTALKERAIKDPSGASGKLLDLLLKKYINLDQKDIDAMLVFRHLQKKIVEKINDQIGDKKTNGPGFFSAFSKKQNTAELIKNIYAAKNLDEIKTVLENEKVSSPHHQCLDACLEIIGPSQTRTLNI